MSNQEIELMNANIHNGHMKDGKKFKSKTCPVKHTALSGTGKEINESVSYAQIRSFVGNINDSNPSLPEIPDLMTFLFGYFQEMIN